MAAGGQDGWWGSANFADQVDRFLGGELIQVPLRPATVGQRFPHQTWLTPAQPQAESGAMGMP
jgi:penicillin amidase